MVAEKRNMLRVYARDTGQQDGGRPVRCLCHRHEDTDVNGLQGDHERAQLGHIAGQIILTGRHAMISGLVKQGPQGPQLRLLLLFETHTSAEVL